MNNPNNFNTFLLNTQLNDAASIRRIMAGLLYYLIHVVWINHSPELANMSVDERAVVSQSHPCLPPFALIRIGSVTSFVG